jgi:hypothetical protein
LFEGNCRLSEATVKLEIDIARLLKDFMIGAAPPPVPPAPPDPGANMLPSAVLCVPAPAAAEDEEAEVVASFNFPATLTGKSSA